MSSRLIHTALIACCLSPISLTTAKAQSDWPTPSSLSHHATVNVVTVADPGIRHHCRLHSITADTLTCGIGFARKPVIYHRDDVSLIIDPPDHSGLHMFYVCLSVAVAGTVAAAIFLPPLAAVAIGVPSIYFALETAMVSDDDSNNESILYQRPNTPLTVTLRTH